MWAYSSAMGDLRSTGLRASTRPGGDAIEQSNDAMLWQARATIHPHASCGVCCTLTGPALQQRRCQESPNSAV